MSAEQKTNFIRRQIEAELASGELGAVVTRFPPEPNGYLHIGHAKAVCLNFGIARDYGGSCALRFDDTNPEKEDAKYAAAIEEDIRWLGFEWSRVSHASDYFGQLHDFAVELIKKGLAYVDGQSAEEIRAGRGTLTEPGVNSRDRERGVEENLKLFAGMKNGDYADGEMVLRAKIDMASDNINLRDPVLYRIRSSRHQRTGDAWRIYPLYDFTHGQSDALENVTHSLCTMEFEDHRALYDWFLEHLTLPGPSRPRQIEFSRLNLNYTVTSKRMLAQLVEGGDVAGWDDPRMPTLSGLRRRGFTPTAIRKFVELTGVTRKHHIADMGLLENCAREDLEARAPRAMAVLRPLKLVIENYPEGESETIDAPNHPADKSMGTRKLRISREVFIERDDFSESPPKKFHRLAPGRAVRLRYAFVVRCTGVRRDEHGEALEVRCEYDADTRRGAQPAGGRVKGVIHWVNAADAAAAEVRLYDRLFACAEPGREADLRAALNPDSLQVRAHALVEPMLAGAAPARWQFERLGYFFPDRDSAASKLVFNRIVTLRDSWARITEKSSTEKSAAKTPAKT
ncbi:MAG: glutamine--tRNA ligase/YqeY domain fusion protein [Gammaproteobacteria bacterium]|nr:glutamine--tRNA ligase/YqeY domain fusion protein [Gammaproteobacteria bacterium]